MKLNDLSDEELNSMLDDKKEAAVDQPQDAMSNLSDEDLNAAIQYKENEEKDYGDGGWGDSLKKSLPTQWLRDRVDAPEYRPGEKSFLGNVFERPGVAIQSAVVAGEKAVAQGNALLKQQREQRRQGQEVTGEYPSPVMDQIEGFKKGWNNPDETRADLNKLPMSGIIQEKRLNDWYEYSDTIRPDWVEDSPYLRGVYNQAQSTIAAAVSVKGMTEDLVSNPAELALFMSGFSGKGGKATIEGGKRVLKGAGTVAEGAYHPMKNVAKPAWQAAKQFGSRLKADYITQQLAPKAFKIYNKNFQKFTTGVQDLARKLKMSKGAIQHVKQFGVDAVSRAKEGLEDLNGVRERVQKGLFGKIQQAEDFYKGVITKAPDRPYKVNNTYNTLKKVLRDDLGVLDRRGNIIPDRVKLLQNDKSAVDLLNIYDDLTSAIVVRGKVNPTGSISKIDYNTYRKIMNKNYNNPNIQKVLQTLHTDMEVGGMKGLKEANKGYGLARRMEKKFVNLNGLEKDTKGSLKANVMERYFKTSKTQQKELADIQKYTNVDFIDDLKNYDAGNEVLKLDKMNITTFQNTLQEAYGGAKRQMIVDKLRPIVGNKEANRLYKEIGKHWWSRKVGGTAAVGIGAGILMSPIRGAINKAGGMISDAVGGGSSGGDPG